ncbi:MAG: transcriptional regulator [Magnetovibrio sp.]|nr:transcriptional regulator [Magnetovibrio sp.]|tara:strand:- start:220 stop:600 length:381 start_codon:yes stop_codon:yes gene_type:complete
MTPFGEMIRELRKSRGITLKKMSEDLGVTSAYFSALEHGHRGQPGSGLVQQICGYFELMWDDAEELKRLASISHPRVVITTAGLSPKATQVANVLAKKIKSMDDETLEWILAEIESRHVPLKGPRH